MQRILRASCLAAPSSGGCRPTTSPARPSLARAVKPMPLSSSSSSSSSSSPRMILLARAAMKDVASAAADASGLTVKEAEAAVRAAFDFIAAEISRGEKVTVAGFGTFERRERPERAGRNPRTGEPLTIAARSAPAFVAAKALKDQVDGGGKK